MKQRTASFEYDKMTSLKTGLTRKQMEQLADLTSKTSTMGITVVTKKVLPEILPWGWKKAVAQKLGLNPNTITNALRTKTGSYNQIIYTAKELYGVEKEN